MIKMLARTIEVFTRVHTFMPNKTDLTFSFNLPYLGIIPETVTLLLQSFDTDLASSAISSAIFGGSESSFISLVPQCKMKWIFFRSSFYMPFLLTGGSSTETVYNNFVQIVCTLPTFHVIDYRVI